ncbi:MAG: hypothetical protein RSD88_08565 [Anaerovoracaceae bacterium]
MNGNAELLNFIYQNSQMGVDTINQLIPIVEDKEFKTHLQTQQREYETFHKKAKEKLNKSGYDEKGIKAFDKMKTYLMIVIDTISDKSPSHIAKMLILGSDMGVTEGITKIRKYEGQVEESIVKLMEQLKDFEENNIQRLQNFL